jgi:excisionase family DNA binding protein
MPCGRWGDIGKRRMRTILIPARLSAMKMRTGEVADVLGLSRQHVMALARRGEIPHETTPLGRLYDPEEVRRVADERDRRLGRRSRPAPPEKAA